MKGNIQEDQVKIEKTYEYINEVYPNGYHRYERESHAEKYTYCRYINSYHDSIPNHNCIFGCRGNYRKTIIPEEESENP